MHNSVLTDFFRRWAVAVAAVVLAGVLACCSDDPQTPDLPGKPEAEVLYPGVLNIKWDTAVTERLERLDAETALAFVDSLLPEAHPCQPAHSDSTKPLVLFYSPTERVPETRHIRISMESRSTT